MPVDKRARAARRACDVDIAYDIGRRRRPPEYKKWHDWAHDRWKLAGRSNLNSMQRLYYAEHEVLRLLKGRNQYLSIHSFDDLVGIGADSVRLGARARAADLLKSSQEAIKTFITYCAVAARDLRLPHGNAVIALSARLRIKRTLDDAEIGC